MKCLCLCLAAWLAVSPAQAYWVIYHPYRGEPGFEDHIPEAPDSLVLPVGRHDPRQSFVRPVARVDGVPVCRPLFPSMVADPVDRALVLRDYRKNGFALSPLELSDSFKRYQRLQFHGIDALRDLRLKAEKATLEDYRRYVADEVKLSAMIYLNARLASTPTERRAMINDYVTGLHRKVTVERLPA